MRFAADLDSPWGSDGEAEMRVWTSGTSISSASVEHTPFVHEGVSGPSLGLGIASGSIGADLARTFLAAQISSPTPDLLLVSRGVLVRFQLLTPMRFLPNASPRVLLAKRVERSR